MKAIISGIGRSGTSNLFDLLYTATFNKIDPGECSSVYEPFLWGPITWGKPYHELGKYLSSLNNISPAGVYSHKEIPMFIDDVGSLEGSYALKYLTKITSQRKHCIAKFIRAGARTSLLEALDDDLKILYLVRNPLRVVNSLGRTFSHYGEGYYPSDLPRFNSEAEALYGDEFLSYKAKMKRFGIIGAQVLYWHYTNKFTYDLIKAGKLTKTRIFIHEELISPSDESLVCLFDYLQMPWRENYKNIFRRNVGHSMASISLCKNLVNAMTPSFELYREIASDSRVSRDFDIENDLSCSVQKLRPKAPMISDKNPSGASLDKENYALNQRLMKAKAGIRDLEKVNSRMERRMSAALIDKNKMERRMSDALIAKNKLARRMSHALIAKNEMETTVETLRASIDEKDERLSCKERELAREKKRITRIELRLSSVDTRLSDYRKAFMLIAESVMGRAILRLLLGKKKYKDLLRDI